MKPTITAHPTEARRRSVLTKQHEITEKINALGTQELTADEIRILKKNIRNQLNLLLMTDEVRAERMSVEDELFHLLSDKEFIRYYNGVWSFKPTESFNIDFYNYKEFVNT